MTSNFNGEDRLQSVTGYQSIVNGEAGGAGGNDLWSQAETPTLWSCVQDEGVLAELQSDAAKDVACEVDKDRDRRCRRAINVVEFIKLNEDAKVVCGGRELKWDQYNGQWLVEEGFTYSDWSDVGLIETIYEAKALEVLGGL